MGNSCGGTALQVNPVGNPKGMDFKPIHSAVRWNNSYDEVLNVLESPEAVNCVDTGNGNRPIHIAAQNGHTDILKLLIEREADLDAKNQKGNTALHMAVEYDYYESCQMLLDAGANPEILNDDGFTAIKGIEGEKSIHVVQLLCAKITEDALDSLNKCLNDTTNIEKAGFVQAGLKVKKSMGAQWTSEAQDLFKQVLAKI